MRCAEMMEPNVSQGAPTVETSQAGNTDKKEASNAIERGLADRPSMGLAKAGFEAAESRLDDFRFSPDSRWANGWPEMGCGPGGEERH
jgi:hypothetical protein